MELSAFKALTFDCYGTLIDWETGILTALRPLTDRLGDALDDDHILGRHAHYESAQQAQTPSKRYAELLAIVYKRLAEEWHIKVDWDDCEIYGRSVENWPAFPDSKDALAYLKEHYQLVVLSNVDNASFSASNQKLGAPFTAVYTAEDIGSYKPSEKNFDYMLQNLAELGIDKPKILHTAESLFHDHLPASRKGLSTAWIFRRHAKQGFGATKDPGEVVKTHFTFHSMAELVEAHKAERG